MTAPSTGTSPETQVAVERPAVARVAAPAIALTLVANLVVYAVARLAGAEFSITTPVADAAQTIGWVSVVVMSVVPLLLGAAALLASRRWAPTSWRVLLGLGLLIAVVSLPVFATASAATKVSLSLMHLVAGAAWAWAISRELRRVARLEGTAG